MFVSLIIKDLGVSKIFQKYSASHISALTTNPVSSVSGRTGPFVMLKSRDWSVFVIFADK